MRDDYFARNFARRRPFRMPRPDPRAAIEAIASLGPMLAPAVWDRAGYPQRAGRGPTAYYFSFWIVASFAVIAAGGGHEYPFFYPAFLAAAAAAVALGLAMGAIIVAIYRRTGVSGFMEGEFSIDHMTIRPKGLIYGGEIMLLIPDMRKVGRSSQAEGLTVLFMALYVLAICVPAAGLHRFLQTGDVFAHAVFAVTMLLCGTGMARVAYDRAWRFCPGGMLGLADRFRLVVEVRHP